MSIPSRFRDLFGQPDLELPEVRWARPASHMQHGIARSGVFYMSGDGLGFEPRRFDTLLGARSRTWRLSELTEIRLKPTLRKLKVTLCTGPGRDRLIVSDALVVYRDLLAQSRK